jgi:hypothetical protein
VPLYVGTVLGYAVYTFAIGGFAYWAPAYIHERYRMDAGKASVVFGMVTVVAGAVGTLVGGVIADRRVRVRLARLAASPAAGADRPPAPPDPRAIDDATARGNLDVPALGSLIGAPLAALAIASTSARTFFGANFPAEVALFLSSGPINVAILRSSPPALRASAMAISIFAIHALGDLWSPWLIGLVADAGAGSASTLQLAMFIAVPLVFGLSALVWWRAVTRSRRLT